MTDLPPSGTRPISPEAAASSPLQLPEDESGAMSLVPHGAPPGSTPTESLFVALERIATDPRADVEKLKGMMELYERMEAAKARQAYNIAMNLAQAEIEPVARTSENTQIGSFYAKLEAVDAAIRPIYTKHGFSLSDDTIAPLVPGNVRIECRCSHVGGHTELFHREAAADTLGPKGAPTKTALHGIGSTETFLRRYLRCGIFNVVFRNLDDDGNGGPLSEAQIAELAALMVRANVGPRFLKYLKWPVLTKEEFEARLSATGFSGEEATAAMWAEFLRGLPGADYAKAKSELLEQIARQKKTAHEQFAISAAAAAGHGSSA